MKNLNWVYVIAALVLGGVLLLKGEEKLAVAAISFVYAVYLQFQNIEKTKEIKDVKETFNKAVGQGIQEYKKARRN